VCFYAILSVLLKIVSVSCNSFPVSADLFSLRKASMLNIFLCVCRTDNFFHYETLTALPLLCSGSSNNDSSSLNGSDLQQRFFFSQRERLIYETLMYSVYYYMKCVVINMVTNELRKFTDSCNVKETN
jgi:hypothetical protein